MWPGQQPPGGEQNPQQNAQHNPQHNQQHNPYQQPGYQQPNPYQQPGYQQYPQANPYGQQPQWGTPAPMGPPQPSQDGGGNRAKVIAMVTAAAVVVAAGVTGFLMLSGKGDKDAEAKDGPTGKASHSPTAEPTATESGPEDNPRGNESEKPLVAGWKVVVNPRWGTAFDVPPDWQVDTPGTAIGFEDRKSDEGKPLIMMSAPAVLGPKWCTSDDDKDGTADDTELAAVGTKGEEGTKNPADVAVREAPWWVYGGYTQPDRKSVSYDKKATAYTTTSGVKGAYVWARSTNTPRKGKCATDGKALTFGFENSAGDLVSFNFYGVKGVKPEVGTATVMKILSTVRLHGEPTES
ncbi:hypothetical protein [Streptomyces sp. NPDC086787]|uniref:hypothetical protein n=1 Tax=Streptomyces sp. NPDC086787 TaxID=3365759 RepID=UPI003816CD7F